MKRFTLMLAFAAVFGVPVELTAQGLTQLNCKVVVERFEQSIRAIAIASVSQPTKVDYRLRTTRIGGGGSASSESSGPQDMPAGEVQSLGTVTMGAFDEGFVEFKLEVRERLTGQTCSATETFSPI